MLIQYDFDSAKIDRSMVMDITTNEKSRIVVDYMTSLINRLGIDCINISGTADGESHAWNNVKLDGEWYEVDVTWNDSDDEDGLTTYDYLNITSNEISVNHSKVPLYKDVSLEEYESMMRELNLFVPECNGQKYNYCNQISPSPYEFKKHF